MQDVIESDIRSDKEYYRNKREYYKAHKEDVAAVAHELKLGKSLIRASSTADSIDLHVSGTLTELKECFRAFRKLGYEPSDRPDEPKMHNFSTYFKNPQKTVRFWLNFTSTICVRKKIGTKMVETSVYETVCE